MSEKYKSDLIKLSECKIDANFWYSDNYKLYEELKRPSDNSNDIKIWLNLQILNNPDNHWYYYEYGILFDSIDSLSRAAKLGNPFAPIVLAKSSSDTEKMKSYLTMAINLGNYHESYKLIINYYLESLPKYSSDSDKISEIVTKINNNIAYYLDKAEDIEVYDFVSHTYSMIAKFYQGNQQIKYKNLSFEYKALKCIEMNKFDQDLLNNDNKYFLISAIRSFFELRMENKMLKDKIKLFENFKVNGLVVPRSIDENKK